MVKYTGRGLVVKRPGSLVRPDAGSCLGGGGLFPSSKIGGAFGPQGISKSGEFSMSLWAVR